MNDLVHNKQKPQRSVTTKQQWQKYDESLDYACEITMDGIRQITPDEPAVSKPKKRRTVTPVSKSGKPYYVFSYDGPIMQFENVAIERFKSTTMAVSEAKAKQNILCRAKRKMNKSPHAGGFKLVNDLVLMEYIDPSKKEAEDGSEE